MQAALKWMRWLIARTDQDAKHAVGEYKLPKRFKRNRRATLTHIPSGFS